MGHSKKSKNDQVVSADVERYERAAERDRKRILLEKIEDKVPGITSEIIDETISEELESIQRISRDRDWHAIHQG